MLGERKLKGLLEKFADRGSIASESTNITIFATRITLRIPSFPFVLRVKMLSFHIDPGFFKPQFGHSDADRLTNFLQLGQSREFLFLLEFIKMLYRAMVVWNKSKQLSLALIIPRETIKAPD